MIESFALGRSSRPSVVNSLSYNSGDLEWMYLSRLEKDPGSCRRKR
jgi:hypothetical protein